MTTSFPVDRQKRTPPEHLRQANNNPVRQPSRQAQPPASGPYLKDPEIPANTVFHERLILRSVIGEGGYGRVYLAHDLLRGEELAVKVVKNSKENEVRVRALQAEGRLMARLAGEQNIVEPVMEGEHNGYFFLAMKFADGDTLEQNLVENGPLSTREMLTVAYALASAEERIHGKGIVHRDVKPANVIVVGSGDDHVNSNMRFAFSPRRVRLLDFGNAVTADVAGQETTILSGTPAYMAPEYAMGRPHDGKVDVYALGITMYELITGDVPFEGQTPEETLMAHISRPPDFALPTHPNLPQPTADLITTFITKDPGNRPNASQARSLIFRALINASAAS